MSKEKKTVAAADQTLASASGISSIRVHFDRIAFAAVTAHAKESVEAEICGVLVGKVTQEAGASIVQVSGIIQGKAAREERTHVTFTHETWNQIHSTLDRDFQGLEIVGWYHTHPGFGVEFSAMDRFIQENFFSGPTQVAYLTDPLGGDTAIAVNSPGGIDYLRQFWVDGREHTLRVPRGAGDASTTSGVPSTGDGPAFREEISRLEARISQLIQAVDDQKRDADRLLQILVIVFCTAIVSVVGYHIWTNWYDRLTPPRTNGYAQIPVKVGDEVVMLGIEVVQWQVPPRLNALLDKVARAQVEEQARSEREIQEQLLEQRENEADGRTPKQ